MGRARRPTPPPLPDRRRRLVATAASVFCVLAPAGCESSDPVDVPSDPHLEPVVRTVRIAPGALELSVPGDTATLTVLVRDDDGNPLRGVTVAWGSSQPPVVAVESTGRVTGTALGQGSVWARVGPVADTVEVEVDPVHSVARNCAPCHERLPGGHATLPFPIGSCWSCHALAGEGHGPTIPDHPQVSGGFSLVGVHVTLGCRGCHAGTAPAAGSGPAGPGDCVACHRADYDAAHGAVFPEACATCHTPTAWPDAAVDHPAFSGGFDLLGVHASLPCAACHAPGSWTLAWSPSGDADCVACHRADYDAAHGAVFPEACATCHTPTAWPDGRVDHPAVSGGFDLLGVHASLPCGACHAPGSWALPWSPSGDADCVACHRADYDAAHAGSGYPTRCLYCHDARSWSGHRFDHDARWFPIWSGEHARRWETGGCATCHPVFQDFGAFTCFACHRHAGPRTAADHTGVADYVYESTACLACHPRGTA